VIAYPYPYRLKHREEKRSAGMIAGEAADKTAAIPRAPMVKQKNMDDDDDELLCLWASTQKEMEDDLKKGQAELERMGPERHGRIHSWLEENKERCRKNKKRKRTWEEEQQQQTECKLKDARQLEEELVWRSGEFRAGWMTIDRCFRVCMPKQVADHAECMRQWRWDLLDSVASMRKQNSMFYFGIAACPYSRAINFNIGHVRNFDVMHILAYGPSRMMGDFEDFLIKYSWMQSDELHAPCCLNQKAGRGGQGDMTMDGYLYLALRQHTIDDCDLKFSKDRQRFLENDDERTKTQLMLVGSSTIRTVRSNTNSDAGTTDARSNTNSDAGTTDAGTGSDTDDTDTDATTNGSVCDAM
jgi:hypothetical protein